MPQSLRLEVPPFLPFDGARALLILSDNHFRNALTLLSFEDGMLEQVPGAGLNVSSGTSRGGLSS